LILYPLHRFLDEMLRADNARIAPTPFTLSQNGSILLFALGVILFMWLRRLPVPSQAPVKQQLAA
jgi:prolipoprotein diacylglyceryltransferase